MCGMTIFVILFRNNQLNNTIIVFFADHGQNLGEHNMWSMMNMMETSARVPMVIRAPRLQTVPLYPHVVELVDLFPTLTTLVGLPFPTNATPGIPLPGTDLTPGMRKGVVVKPVNAAFSQITRCKSCILAYWKSPSQCLWDALTDLQYTVPCAIAPKEFFNWMGMSVRTSSWRYTTWCPWNGTDLAVVDWSSCTLPELYDHRNDTALYDVDFVENVNLVNDSRYSDIQRELFQLILQKFANSKDVPRAQ